MIDASRRHGTSDPRFSFRRRTGGQPTAGTTAHIRELPNGLDWPAFSSRLFPDRRRHDFEVLKAYEVYLNASRETAEVVPARSRAAGDAKQVRQRVRGRARLERARPVHVRPGDMTAAVAAENEGMPPLITRSK
jgi:hypothetical protein